MDSHIAEIWAEQCPDMFPHQYDEGNRLSIREALSSFLDGDEPPPSLPAGPPPAPPAHLVQDTCADAMEL